MSFYHLPVNPDKFQDLFKSRAFLFFQNSCSLAKVDLAIISRALSYNLFSDRAGLTLLNWLGHTTGVFGTPRAAMMEVHKDLPIHSESSTSSHQESQY